MKHKLNTDRMRDISSEGHIFLLFCHFCLISLQVQPLFSLQFPYEHAKLFSMCFESSFVIGQQLRELACDWPADK